MWILVKCLYNCEMLEEKALFIDPNGFPYSPGYCKESHVIAWKGS